MHLLQEWVSQISNDFVRSHIRVAPTSRSFSTVLISFQGLTLGPILTVVPKAEVLKKLYTRYMCMYCYRAGSFNFLSVRVH